MNFKSILWGLLLLGAMYHAKAQRLDLFVTHDAKKTPYGATAGFYDFISDSIPPDSITEGISWYYVYFRLPSEVHEVGVRMISPVPSYSFANVGDHETSYYQKNKKQKSWFDPSIYLEKAILDSTDETTIVSWQLFGKNDNSEEMLSQPDGKKNNALIRVFFEPYPPGLYRVRFNKSSNKQPAGSYLLQIGTVPATKRLQVSRSINFPEED